MNSGLSKIQKFGSDHEAAHNRTDGNDLQRDYTSLGHGSCGQHLTNKYAEGYLAAGTTVVATMDVIETLVIIRKSYSAAKPQCTATQRLQANTAVYLSCLKRDTVLDDLAQGCT